MRRRSTVWRACVLWGRPPELFAAWSRVIRGSARRSYAAPVAREDGGRPAIRPSLLSVLLIVNYGGIRCKTRGSRGGYWLQPGATDSLSNRRE
jgi:hypothetical protein